MSEPKLGPDFREMADFYRQDRDTTQEAAEAWVREHAEELRQNFLEEAFALIEHIVDRETYSDEE